MGQAQGNQGIARRHTQCMPHKKSRRLTPRSHKRAISGWKLIHRIIVDVFAFLSIFVPTDSEQNAHRYSYLSPSESTRRSLLRTGTARLHLGQYNCDASNSLNASAPAFLRLLPEAVRLVSALFIINKTFYSKQIMTYIRQNIDGFMPGITLIRSTGYYFLSGILSTS